ncbi:hypothetical protein AALB_0518 [Agarivorans albus MKT 106]|uniref:Uncharacterized protein n=1 Tax=Agarivorans albus MKT 106 TaxID=1331007 RepID=R9PGS7_AGAAL|nr:hypothetical protein AALB_0518 [Agarivorans albus MKT 106]
MLIEKLCLFLEYFCCVISDHLVWLVLEKSTSQQNAGL